MGAYRCLNCGVTSRTTSETCHNRACGFRVGRFEYDSELETPPGSDDSLMGLVIACGGILLLMMLVNWILFGAPIGRVR
jgi:hypothetical protein